MTGQLNVSALGYGRLCSIEERPTWKLPRFLPVTPAPKIVPHGGWILRRGQ